MSLHPLRVTPFAGVWIEMYKCLQTILSPPVTPFAGVWIEIENNAGTVRTDEVTPFAGVWIEILSYLFPVSYMLSLPSRECGLKF